MTALAMGAATRPPVASEPASPPRSTTTATATRGSSAGAKPMNQACGAAPASVLRRPRLAGHPHAGDPGGGARPGLHDRLHHRGELVGDVARHGLLVASPARPGRERLRSGARSSRTRNGFITVPPLATPAATIAICSGVTRTSRWPIADWASEGGSRSPGDGALRDPLGHPQPGVVEPERRRPARAAASSPRSRPSWANAVLQEIRSASASVEVVLVAAGLAAEVAQRRRWSAAGPARSATAICVSRRDARPAAPRPR